MTDNPFKPLPARITHICAETDLDFTITVAASCQIAPGQFFQVSLPKVGEAPISVSSFAADFIKFTIRAVGRLTNVLHNLRVGDNLFIRGPYGVGFPLEKFHDQHVIIVAGGSGLAPVRPLINLIVDGHLPVASLTLIAGFKNRSGILFNDELARWQKKCEVILTIDKTEDGWDGATGLVTEYIRKLSVPAGRGVQAVVVGPPVMMKFATAEFRLLGLPSEKIWVSFERLMSCGIGKCGHCKIDSTYICLEGPVLNYVHAAKLID